jgi:hypothetical protein
MSDCVNTPLDYSDFYGSPCSPSLVVVAQIAAAAEAMAEQNFSTA